MPLDELAALDPERQRELAAAAGVAETFAEVRDGETAWTGTSATNRSTRPPISVAKEV
jgi:hypothetical protein